MHGCCQRGPDGPGAGFLGQQHRREYDDEDQTQVTKNQLHRKGGVAPGIGAGGRAQLVGYDIDDHRKQTDDNDAEVRQLAPHRLGGFVSQQGQELAMHGRGFR